MPVQRHEFAQRNLKFSVSLSFWDKAARRKLHLGCRKQANRESVDLEAERGQRKAPEEAFPSLQQHGEGWWKYDVIVPLYFKGERCCLAGCCQGNCFLLGLMSLRFVVSLPGAGKSSSIFSILSGEMAMGFAQLCSIRVNDYEAVLKHHQDTHGTAH